MTDFSDIKRTVRGCNELPTHLDSTKHLNCSQQAVLDKLPKFIQEEINAVIPYVFKKQNSQFKTF